MVEKELEREIGQLKRLNSKLKSQNQKLKDKVANHKKSSTKWVRKVFVLAYNDFNF